MLEQRRDVAMECFTIQEVTNSELQLQSYTTPSISKFCIQICNEAELVTVPMGTITDFPDLCSKILNIISKILQLQTLSPP